MGKMQTAKSDRSYKEYQASIDSARRVEEMNQARLNYQRQLAEYEQRLTDREFQVTQIQEKLNNVENAVRGRTGNHFPILPFKSHHATFIAMRSSWLFGTLFSLLLIPR